MKKVHEVSRWEIRQTSDPLIYISTWIEEVPDHWLPFHAVVLVKTDVEADILWGYEGYICHTAFDNPVSFPLTFDDDIEMKFIGETMIDELRRTIGKHGTGIMPTKKIYSMKTRLNQGTRLALDKQ